ncbi:MAG: sigma-70 family RNA polymerase sigma factor [Bacilli bacterium]|nr:sigma-70 family RNA polymerase sigma factor [Bacilli bacterium]
MDKLLDYEGLVYRIIYKYPSRFDKNDLYQVGMMGLVEAYKHYKECYDTKFSTFAYYYIIGEVNKYIRENSCLKVGRDFIELNKKILKTKEAMIQKLGREPTNLEISLFLEVDEALIEEALLATEEVDSLDDVYDKISSDDSLDTRADILDLRNELDKLPIEEKKLIYNRYYQDMTQMETSKSLGMSQVQVSRNEAKILQKLKTRL